jgi:hypothetical protein
LEKSKLPLKTVIANVRSFLFIFTLKENYSMRNDQKERNRGRSASGFLFPARPLAFEVLRDGRARKETFIGSCAATLSVLPYGIGLGPGVGSTSQTADAQGGRGGVGIRNSLP